MGNTFKLGNYVNGLFQDTSNNIGIGGSPSGSYKLEVTGTAKVSSTLLLGGALTGSAVATFTAAANPLILKSTSATTGYTEYYYNTSTLAGIIGNGGGILSGANNSDFIIRSEADFVVAAGGNNRRMTITSGGNVGIGTSSPAGTLQVAGDIYLGTYHTTNKLCIGADTNDYLQYNSGLDGILMASYGATAFYTNNAERMRITSDGRVGINTTTPQSGTNLDVVGQNSAANSFGIFTIRNSSATGISMGASGTSYIWIQGNVYGSGTQMITLNPIGGNVSIGTTTDFGYKLNLNGQPGANGYTLWTNWSDLRLKENIVDFEAINILDKIDKIRPVTYNYNELSGFDEETRNRRISGFIAQELKEIFPDMVGTIIKEDIEYYDTNLSNLDLYLVKAIQELNKKLIRNNIN